MHDAALATLGEQAYRTMRSMIVSGELPAGHWLRKRRLADQLQMSATPVVEALRRLQHEGLVETEPQWGARVRVLTVAELQELSAMREVLEGLVAARCASAGLTSGQLASLRQQAEQVDRLDRSFTDPAVAQDRRGAPADEDAAFHLRLAEDAGLSLVCTELERLRMLKATLRMWMVPAPPTRVSHVQIVQAIATGKPAHAEDVMRRHIRDNAEQYLAELRHRFGDGPILLNQSASTARRTTPPEPPPQRTRAGLNL